MAAEAEIEGGAEAATARKKLPIMLIAIVAAVVVIGGGAAAFFMLSGKPGDAHAEAVHEAFTFNLPPMTVNLNTDDGSAPAFMKLSIALEVASEEVMTEIQPRLARVIDAFQVYLRELRRSDLAGSAGIYRMKEELQRRINLAVFPARVDNLLFKEFLVQ